MNMKFTHDRPTGLTSYFFTSPSSPLWTRPKSVLVRSGMASPYHSIPKHHPSTSLDATQSSWNRGRLSFRTRRRVTYLLLVATFASIALLYSQQFLGERYPQPQADLQFDSPPLTVTITRTAPPTTETLVVKPPVQPVVFSLLMYSESAAMEGAVLMKVFYLAFLVQHCGLV